MRHSIQYTIRNVPPAIDAELKTQAIKQGISLNKLVLQKLGVSGKPSAQPKMHRDLDWFFNDETPETRADAEELDRIIREERRKDRERAQREFDAEKDDIWV